VRRHALVAVLILAALAGCKRAPDRAIRFVDLDSGSHATKTGTFHPTGSWKMTYSWDCKRQHSEGLDQLDRFALEVFNADDDSTSFETPEINATGPTGKSTVPYTRSGWYYVTVNSPCDWRLIAEDTSKA
jgi:hypothetical protein